MQLNDPNNQSFLQEGYISCSDVSSLSDDFSSGDEIEEEVDNREASQSLPNSSSLLEIHRMSNDMKFQYAGMVMNALNSGDFIRIQNFLRTYMNPQCSFLTVYDIDSSHGLPPQVWGTTPKMYSYYFLGIYAMCPDLIFSMKSAKVVTSPYWSGTKIVMDIVSSGTKLLDLHLGDWVPQYRQYFNNMNRSASGGEREQSEEGEVGEGGEVNGGEGGDIRSNGDCSQSSTSLERKRIRLNRNRTLNDHYIPENYLEQLIRRSPINPLKPYIEFTGSLTLYLSEEHHMQHVHLQMNHNLNARPRYSS
mmetsp:Transcript_58423/g.114917  ORF Transcript_58423/g.114917 Transcript_58423/m.114917 type:complete len:305 (+) Transcript_58423:48-962(+)|eukprot:CAMPEP_0170379778 /NCGR_PEP_ID=MMETSP0117_2-20130122/13516_1 /TAXON_ID=400756 /ORGANISM="Durinskia baltica, Strain CSIRO CS-38" /LENGTH=304 /DNA_ID=CAMNT_0010635223 /DNA_START=48 /DNA_END=962 /DNA_ORIENTATION=-